MSENGEGGSSSTAEEKTCECCKARFIQFELKKALTKSDACQKVAVKAFWDGTDPEESGETVYVYNLPESAGSSEYCFEGDAGDFGYAILDEQNTPPECDEVVSSAAEEEGEGEEETASPCFYRIVTMCNQCNCDESSCSSSSCSESCSGDDCPECSDGGTFTFVTDIICRQDNTLEVLKREVTFPPGTTVCDEESDFLDCFGDCCCSEVSGSESGPSESQSESDSGSGDPDNPCCPESNLPNTLNIDVVTVCGTFSGTLSKVSSTEWTGVQSVQCQEMSSGASCTSEDMIFSLHCMGGFWIIYCHGNGYTLSNVQCDPFHAEGDGSIGSQENGGYQPYHCTGVSFTVTIYE
jgi:hypothetical protein